MSLVQKPRTLALLCLLTILPAARPAWAWKVTIHQAVAVKAAQDLPDGDLKALILGNERYLRAGSMGPDIFYLPPFMAYGVYSDLAHYCLTDQLALNMVCFAGGWFAHNISGSLAPQRAGIDFSNEQARSSFAAQARVRSSRARAMSLAVPRRRCSVARKVQASLTVPIEWFPRLRDATDEQRTHWEMIGAGFGFHWPELDEDVSVAGLLGLPD